MRITLQLVSFAVFPQTSNLSSELPVRLFYRSKLHRFLTPSLSDSGWTVPARRNHLGPSPTFGGSTIWSSRDLIPEVRWSPILSPTGSSDASRLEWPLIVATGRR